MMDPKRTRYWFFGLGLPAQLWLVVFLGMPFALIVLLSLGWDLGQSFAWKDLQLHEVQRALRPPFQGVFVRSLWLSAVATSLCLLLAMPLCILLWRLGPRRGQRWLLLILAPFLINFLVRIYAWFVLLRPEGLVGQLALWFGWKSSLISSLEGILLGLVYGYLPFMILPLWSVMEKLDPKLWEAAEDLGANFFIILRRIVLPHCLPGIAAGSILVFVPMLGEYTIPKMLGGGMIPTLGTSIESQFFSGVNPHWSFGAALSCLLMILVAALLVTFRGAWKLATEDGGGMRH